MHPSSTLKLIPPNPPQSRRGPISSPTTDSGLLLREKILYLTSLKVNPQKALTLNPTLRTAHLSTLQSVESCLLSMGLPRLSLGRILDMQPSLLTAHPDVYLYPVLDFLLNEVRLPFPDISPSISRCPRILVSPVSSQLRPTLAFLRSLGMVVDFHTSLLLVYNVERSLLRKLRFLLTLGFTEEEAKTMVIRSPGILTLSVERNLGPKAGYFLSEIKGDLEELKRFPQYFSFSLERRIMPRHRMLLEYGFKLPLLNMLRVSDGEFKNRLLDMRLRMADEKEKKKQS